MAFLRHKMSHGPAIISCIEGVTAAGIACRAPALEGKHVHRRSFFRLMTGSALGYILAGEAHAPSSACPGVTSDGSAIALVGIGGAGSNLLSLLRRDGRYGGARSILIDADPRTCRRSKADCTIWLEDAVWSNPLAMELRAPDKSSIANALAGADTICILAGLGGRTGSWVAAQVALLGYETGACTFSVVTTPFAFEGERRRKRARLGHIALTLYSAKDCVEPVSNDALLAALPGPVSILDVLAAANGVAVDRMRNLIGEKVAVA